MTHQTTITNFKQLADGLVAIQAQCCGGPGSFSWLTMRSEDAADPVKRQSNIDFHLNRIATLHDATLTALQVLPTLVGTTSKITIPAPEQPVSTTLDPSSPDPTAPNSSAPADPSGQPTA